MRVENCWPQYEVLYLGCWPGKLGHYVYAPGGVPVVAPWELYPATRVAGLPIMDGDLMNLVLPALQLEGEGRYVYSDKRSAVWFWTRRIDTRPGSHAAFICEGRHEPDVILEKARIAFPTVMEALVETKITVVPFPAIVFSDIKERLRCVRVTPSNRNEQHYASDVLALLREVQRLEDLLAETTRNGGSK
jgi:hypothetical protein